MGTKAAQDCGASKSDKRSPKKVFVFQPDGCGAE